MPTPESYKTLVSIALAALLIIAASGCDDNKAGRSTILNNSADSSRAQLSGSDNADRLDFGENWDAAARTDRGQGRSIRDLSGPPPQSPREGGTSSFWAIVLGTYTGDNHAQAARNMLNDLPRISPELHGARVQQTSRGSLVIYGRYDGPDDPRARRDLERIKAMTYGGMQVFGRAFLSRVTPPSAQRGGHPHALLSVRQIYPNTDPLYTLQVAAWGDFGSGTLSTSEIRRRAEAYTQQLRTQGHEAFFHHDDAMRLSIVTVGLFNHQAFDPETGDRSPELRMLMQRFPAHLVNGEKLREPIDPRRPSRGTRVQEPRLVLVPKP